MEAFDTWMVLGAGASHGARNDHCHISAPPLGNKLATYLLEWWNAHPHFPPPMANEKSVQEGEEEKALRTMLEQTAKREQSSELAFEKIVSELLKPSESDQGRILRLLNLLIMRSFCALNEPPFHNLSDGYDQLVCLPALANRRVAVISLNYDVLLTQALERAQIWNSSSHGYVLEAEAIPETPWVQFKPHGSIDWHQQTRMFPEAKPITWGGTLQGSVSSVDNDSNVIVRHWSNLCSNFDFGSEEKRQQIAPWAREVAEASIEKLRCEFAAPILATYAPGKPIATQFPVLGSVRKQTKQAIEYQAKRRSKTSVVVVGINIPKQADDGCLYEYLEMLGRLNGKRLFVNPSDEHFEDARKLGFMPRKQTFSDFIGSANSVYA